MSEAEKLRVYEMSIEEGGNGSVTEDLRATLNAIEARFDDTAKPFDREAARRALEAAPVSGGRLEGHLEFGYEPEGGGEIILAFVEVAEMTRAELDALPEFEGW
jgi:hypothetical protein